MEGEIEKWTNMFGGYQKRYLILKGEILYYCESQGSPFKGKVHLLVSTINEMPDEECKFEINTGSCVFFFKTETPEEKGNWVKALKYAKIQTDNNFKKHQQLENSDDFIFVSNDIRDFPEKIKMLYSNCEEMHNMLNNTEKDIISLNIKYGNDVSSLKSFVDQELDLSRTNIKLLNSLIENFKEFNTGLSKFTSFMNFGGRLESNRNLDNINEVRGHINDNNNSYNDNKVSVVRSGVNPNLLFDTTSKNTKKGKSLVYYMKFIVLRYKMICCYSYYYYN